jgi:outer membrane protein assembly factor BamB
MRCPIPTCRQIFTVESEPPASPPTPPPAATNPPPTPPAKNQRSGTVGDMVPILRAESAVPKPPEPPRTQTTHVSEVVPLVQAELAEPPPQKPQDAPSWQQAPPPRRGGKTEQPPTRPRPAADGRPNDRPAPAPTLLADELPVAIIDNTDPSAPLELPPGQWEPPPVRRGANGEVTDALVVVEAGDDLEAAFAKKRRARRLMIALVCGVFFLLGVGGAVLWYVMRDTEDKLFAQASAEYKEAKYTAAEGHFQGLYDKFPASGRRNEYAFLKKLSGLRGRLATSRAPDEAFGDVEAFLNDTKDDTKLKSYVDQYRADIGAAAVKAAQDFANTPTIDDTTPAALKRAEKLLADVRDELGDDAIKKEDADKVAAAFDGVRKQHGDWTYRRDFTEQLEKVAKMQPAEALREAKRLVKAAEARLPGIGQSADISRLLDKMRDDHFAGVKYEAGQPQPELPARDLDYPCILVDANRFRTTDLGDGKLVLAVARGVLYALRHGDGQPVWAMRVGIDTTIPPLRVPPAAGVSERILVLSADTKTLTAIDENGTDLWHYVLSSPCLGRPVLVDQRVFLPTFDGQVHEVHLADGRPLGRYQLGQRLTRGGVRQPRTPLVYFPADDSCVYVLNVNDHKCEAILYTEHPASSLRSEPLIFGANAADQSGWLVLNQQAQGGDEVRLRLFELPVKQGQSGELLSLKRPPRLPGMTSFPPHQDGEKLAMVTDTGVLGLYGIKQPHTKDQELFPWLPGSGAVELAPFLRPHAHGHGRAEVVRVQGDDLWVLADGQLQRLQLELGGPEGLRLAAAWPEPLALGWPQHASRVENGTIFLVTQALGSGACLATAVDDDTGKIQWQRQLGLVCRGGPLTLRAPAGPPVVLTMDQGGGLFAFDPLRFDPDAGEQWQSGGQSVAPALDLNPRVAPFLLPGEDGDSAFQIVCRADGKEVVIRQITVDAQRLARVERERRVQLVAPLEGTPAVAGPLLVLPLADGDLHHLRWKADTPEAKLGPDWRVRRAAPDARGHVVALGGDRVLTTDGSRSLIVYQAGDKEWRQLPTPEAALELKDRIIAPPVRLPNKAKDEVCVVDAGGVVTLLEVAADGSLKVMREWKVGVRGNAARLFVRLQGKEVRVGCVVEQDPSRLAWIDPQREEPAWEYHAEGAIVGAPEMVDGLLVIADRKGTYTAVDPRTGKADRPGYTLRAGSIAPAAAPVSFGRGRVFAPLTDGTVMMLPMSVLRNPLRGFSYP